MSTFAATIPVYWHVIHASTGEYKRLLKALVSTSKLYVICLAVSDGYIPDSQIADSISAMNTHYRNSGSTLTFSLAGTTRTQNS